MTNQVATDLRTEARRALEFCEKVLDMLTNDPDIGHEQASWGMEYGNDNDETACGTTLCLAGAAAVADPDTTVFWASGSRSKVAVMRGDVEVREHGRGNRTASIESRAAELLGLHLVESVGSGDVSLFYIEDNKTAMKAFQRHIAALRGLVDSFDHPEAH